MCVKDVQKVEEQELPVPLIWRRQLKLIADQLLKGDASSIEGVRPIDPEVVEIGLYNIQEYPEKIIPLQDITWSSSIYSWMGEYWEVLVDLTSETGETSDLVLHARVYEMQDEYEFEVGLTYVP